MSLSGETKATSREWTYQGTRGELAARRWVGSAAPDHVVLIAHGYGEHIGRYQRVAGDLVANGAVVFAVDHIGHGKSEGERVLIESFEDVVTDLHGLADQARAEFPGLPMVLLGHSMGGMIGARYAQRHQSELVAFVISSPVIGSWSAATSMLAADEIPDVPLDVSTLSRDPNVGKVYDEDPLIWHGPFKRTTIASLDKTIRDINAGPRLAIPVLWIHGDDDQLVLLAESKPGVERLAGEHVSSSIYPGARHELFNETNAAEVTENVTGWIRGVIAGG